MDIKAKVEEIAQKLKKDPALLEKFTKDPTGAVESLLGIDLPEEQINKAVELIKAKLDLDKASAFLGGLFGKK